MRLIDADKIKFTEYINGDVTVSKQAIHNMPTAYDADKVSEQLENLRDRFDSEDFHIRGILEKAIEIVKSGGVTND